MRIWMTAVINRLDTPHLQETRKCVLQEGEGIQLGLPTGKMAINLPLRVQQITHTASRGQIK